MNNNSTAIKRKIRLTKAIMYLLLIVATALFGVLSFILYTDDLEEDLEPQIIRAITQVSQVLPQLEENEQALREVNTNLETSRKRLYEHNGDLLTEEAQGTDENVETVIDHTLSWMNRVAGLKVGRQGHVVVISAEDFSILAHPEEEYIGERLYPADATINTDDIPNIEEINGKIKEKDIASDFHLFFPESFFAKGRGLEVLLDSLDQGMLGSVFSYKDTYIICGVTLEEMFSFVILRCLVSTLLFLVIAWIFCRFVGFSLGWNLGENEKFRTKLFSYGALAVVVVFASTWYFQTMQDMTGDIATMNEHAQAAVGTLDTYKEYREELSSWLDDQYLEQCRMVSKLILAKGRNEVTRADLAEYAAELSIKYIYVFDKEGKVTVTNSPYDHFTISENPEDQSYAFRPLLAGRDYVIQDVRKDEADGVEMQYIGVGLRDENDLADGFVQIAIDPALRSRLIDPINVKTVLDNLVIGLPDYAFAVDKESLQIVESTGLIYKGTNISELGISEEDVRGEFNGIFIIRGTTYYCGISEAEEVYLMPMVKGTSDNSALFVALKLALCTLIAVALISLLALIRYRGILKVKAEEDAANEAADEETEDLQPEFEFEDDEGRGILSRLKGIIKVQEKYGFESRWTKQSSIPKDEQTPEMRTGRIIYRVLLIFSILVVLGEFILINFGFNSKYLNGLSYILLGNWDEGVNLFSASYCLFLLCAIYVFKELINTILYHIAKISDLKKETILILLRNALKYGCALLFLYLGLAKFGVDTKTLWASAGVLSLMIGFGAKDLVNDIIAGIFIIFEGTFKIGDFITVGSWRGTVQEIGIRSTKVAFFNDVKIFNNSSLKDIVRYGEKAVEIVTFPISYETDILEVEKMLEKELPLLKEKIPGLLKAPTYEGVASFEDSSVMLRLKFSAYSYMRMQAKRGILREIKLLFDKYKINIPFNHIVVMKYEDEPNTYVYEPLEEETPEGEVPEEGNE
ncbi:MAG: mechanosensitive ion channel [Lachnospiraceae bacterium]|nr:mechanosensitive ion channel [Lachnospiraceae bacterium]